MNTDEQNALNAVIKRMSGCAANVHVRLGCGFVAKVCQNSLVIELPKSRLFGGS